jgi:hypothetical protein
VRTSGHGWPGSSSVVAGLAAVQYRLAVVVHLIVTTMAAVVGIVSRASVTPWRIPSQLVRAYPLGRPSGWA